jgi:hypothetical protein
MQKNAAHGRTIMFFIFFVGKLLSFLYDELRLPHIVLFILHLNPFFEYELYEALA